MLTEGLIRQRLQQVNEALAEIERQRGILLEARRSDERLLEIIQAGGASASTAPPLEALPRLSGERPATKSEAAIRLIESAKGAMVTTDQIIDALRLHGYQVNEDRVQERRNTAWLIRDQIRQGRADVANPAAHQWVWRPASVNGEVQPAELRL